MDQSGVKRRSKPGNLALSPYVRRRNGVPLGAPGSLTNMLRRSFGARSFAESWRYWTPIFGYYLGRFVYAPLKRFFPPSVGLVATFVVSGMIHDIVTTAVRGDIAFLFTAWFFLLGAGVVLGGKARMDLARNSRQARVAVHAACLAGCLGLVLITGEYAWVGSG